MIILWFSYGLGIFPVYDFDTVLVTISIRLRGKARLGKQLGCKSENHSKTLASTSKPVLGEAGDVSKPYWNRIKIVTKSYQNRIKIVSKPYPNRKPYQNRIKVVSKPYPNRKPYQNRMKIVTGRILEIISKSYRNRKNNYSRKWQFARTLNVTSLGFRVYQRTYLFRVPFLWTLYISP